MTVIAILPFLHLLEGQKTEVNQELFALSDVFQHKTGHLRRLRRGAENRLVIFAENLKPGADIIGMTDGRANADFGANKRGGKLGDQLFAGV